MSDAPKADEPKADNFFTVNRKIAVTPPSVQGLQVNVRNGFGTADQKVAPARVRVLFRNANPWGGAPEPGKIHVAAGDFVLVNASHLNSVASAKFTYAGVEFVLIEESAVLGVEKCCE